MAEETEDVAKLLAEAMATLIYDKSRAGHAEQIVQAESSFLSGQDDVPTLPHSFPALRARLDTPTPSKVLNPLEIIQN